MATKTEAQERAAFEARQEQAPWYQRWARCLEDNNGDGQKAIVQYWTETEKLYGTSARTRFKKKVK